MRAETRGRNLAAGSEAEAMLVTGLLLMAFIAIFLIHPGPPAQGWYCSQWPVFFHIDHESRQCPTGLITGQSYGDTFSVKNLSCQICVGLDQVGKTQPA